MCGAGRAAGIRFIALEAYYVLVGWLGIPGFRLVFASVLPYASKLICAESFQAALVLAVDRVLLEFVFCCQELLHKFQNA